MDREKMLERVRKLLALGRRSPNAAEAESALAAAQRLMEEYNLTEAEADRPAGDWTEAVLQRARRLGIERDILAMILQEFFFVRILIGYELVDDRLLTTFVVFGRPENVAVAEYAYTFLRREFLGRIRRTKPKSPKSYVFGLGAAVVAKLREERRSFGSRSDSTAIVLSSRALDEALEARHPDMPAVKMKAGKSEPCDQMRGRMDGRDINLQKPLPSPAEQSAGRLPAPAR